MRSICPSAFIPPPIFSPDTNPSSANYCRRATQYDEKRSDSERSFHAAGAGHSTQLRYRFDGAVVGRPRLGRFDRGASQQMPESYGHYISAIYADRFDSYAGQKLEVTGEPPAAAGVMVKSQITKANGELVKVDYMMRPNSDDRLISDIYLHCCPVKKQTNPIG